MPDLIYVTIRTNQPVNLSGAFEEPVRSKEGYAKKSAEKLFEHAGKVYTDYCDAPVKSFIIGHEEILGAEKVSLSELLEKLHKYVADEVV